MVPEGFSEMDRYTLLLGKIEGQLERLIEEFTEERQQAHQERSILFEKVGKIELIEARLSQLETKVDGLKSQTMSNKTEMDKFKSVEETKKITSLHTMKLLGLLGTVLAAVGTVLWMVASWVSSHWDSVATFLKSKL